MPRSAARGKPKAAPRRAPKQAHEVPTSADAFFAALVFALGVPRPRKKPRRDG